ncbi:MAG: hypothetical protein JRJ00_07660 [Deltaproteobacteria bacterium]|nr:hypothetical protein [Deltaproteobacteria bacterium]
MIKSRRLILPALFATCLISCVTQQNAAKKTEITRERSGEVTQQKASVYYAGIDGLKLYAQPRFSKDHILALPLNEKLLRYKTSKGFAYVKVVSTGQVGWVENGQLKWKKVTTEKKPGQETGKELTPSKESGEKAEEKRSGPGILKPAEAEAAPVPSTTPQAIEKPKKPDASVLDAL